MDFNNKTYINRYDIPAQNGAVVTYRDFSDLKNKKQKLELKKVLAGLVLVFFTLVSSLQLNYVQSALAEGLPISSPLTSPEVPQNPEQPQNPGNNDNNSNNNSGNNNNNSNNNSNNNGNNGGGGGGAPSCNDSKPGSTPKLTQAQVVGANQVKLTWTKALNPVSHYLLSFGVKSNNPLYGDPNIGDKNTTSYVVKGLQPGATYFFKVSAVNNCTPGDTSNELSIKVRKGAIVNAPVFVQIGNQAIKQGSAKNIKYVANNQKQNKPAANSNPKNEPKNSNENKPTVNIFSGIGSMFGKFMNFMSDPAYN